MGMFDSVKVPCPKCGELYEAQSKGGDCLLRTYSLDEAPADVLSDVNRHAPFRCDICECYFVVSFKTIGIPEVVDEDLLAHFTRRNMIWRD